MYSLRVKTRLHELLQQDREFTREDREQINPGNALSINAAMDFVKNPVRCCQHVHTLIQKLMDIVRIKKDDPKTKGTIFVVERFDRNVAYLFIKSDQMLSFITAKHGS